jgi:chromosome segregation ATPase
LQTAREAITKQQQGLNTAGLEHQLVNRELQDLRTSAQTVAEVSRENERLKSRLESNKLELTELHHKLQMAGRDVLDRGSECKELERRLGGALEECETLRDMKSALEEHVANMTQTIAEVKSKNVSSEASLRELRTTLDDLRKEIDQEVL